MKTKSKNKQGISLIVLVITIIVMIILAAAIILSLSSNGIIDRANEAVDKTDLKQMQTLAAILWTEEYLDGKRGGNLVEKIDNGLLALDTNYKSKYDITITDSGVSIERKKEEWLTIFEGTAQAASGMIFFQNCNLLKEGYKYRITVESDKFNGSINTSPKYVQNDGEMPIYGLFALYGNNAMGIELDMNVEEEFGKLGSEAIAVFGTRADTGTRYDIMLFQGDAAMYKITKVERTREMILSGIKIFESNDVINMDETIKTTELNPLRNYIFVFEIKGNIVLINALPDVLLGEPIFYYNNTDKDLIITVHMDGTISSNRTATLKAIYDVGKNE